MNLRVLALGVLVLLFVGTIAWADHCVICYRATAPGEKYCDVCKGALMAEQTTALREKELVDEVKKRREEYAAALNKLRQFYYDTGNAERLAQASFELGDLMRVRQYDYQGLEDILGDLNPTKNLPEANELFDRAQALRRRAWPPWGSEQRLREALKLYLQLVEKYPESNRVPEAAFAIGDILERAAFREYRRAARWYERAFQWDPKIKLPARYCAAVLYEEKLCDYEKAARLYYMAAQLETDPDLRQKALERLQQLQYRGFGRNLESESENKPASEAVPVKGK